MNLIKQIRLYTHKGESDKIYEVDLYELPGEEDKRYIVNFRYNYNGVAMNEGSKTPEPVALDEAEKIFSSLIEAKTSDGYQQNESVQTADNSSAAIADTKSANHLVRNEIEPVIFEQLQALLKSKDYKSNKLKRLAWRAGELRLMKTVPVLQSLVGLGDDLLDYCLVWSLGRCANQSSFGLVSQVYQSAKQKFVRRIGFEAMLAIAPADQQQELFNEVRKRLPELAQQCLKQGDYTKLSEQLAALIETNAVDANDVLSNLYLIALIDPAVRTILLRALPGIPLTPNRFKAIRYIYKAAEFRDDCEVFGLLTAVIERSKPFARRLDYYYDDEVRLPGSYKTAKMSVEASKPDSRLAFTDRTRDYFRRRSWRTLKRRADVGDDIYIKYACALLLSVSDQDGNQGFKSTSYRRQDDGSEWGTYVKVTVDYPAFNGFIAFNHILYDNSARYGFNRAIGRWYCLNSVDFDEKQREEGYRDLWDKHPDALVQLLCKSGCKEVHLFAAKAFEPNRNYWPKVSNQELLAFLDKPYAVTAKLGLEIARQRYNPEQPDIELIRTLINSVLDQARIQAQNWIESASGLLAQHPDLLISIMTSSYKEVRAWARELATGLGLGQQEKQGIVIRVFAYLQGIELENENSLAIVNELKWYLLELYAEQSRTIDFTIIIDLLEHKLLMIKLLAAELLSHNQLPVEKLPADLIKSLIESEHPGIRAIGVRLFGELPVEVLVNELDLISAYCLSEDADVRQASRPMVKRLLAFDRDFSLQLMRELSDTLFRKEPVAGFHDDIISVLTEEMSSLNAAIDKNTVWRLLMARSNAANRFGGHLLAKLSAHEFSVRQWARLAKSPVVSVREWVWNAYRNNLDIVKQNPVDGLRILESQWDDSRAFAISYFRDQFKDNDWNAELMIAVCDSVREDVQQLGCELLGKYFEQGQGSDILSKISQHPSVKVQLFTANYLENYAAADPQRIGELELYFITVLSHINKSRLAKSRLLEFLHKQALASAEVADIVARILGRQSVTVVLRDHSDYLLVMRDLQNKYPTIDLPIKKRAIQLKNQRQENKKHAV